MTSADTSRTLNFPGSVALGNLYMLEHTGETWLSEARDEVLVPDGTQITLILGQTPPGALM